MVGDWCFFPNTQEAKGTPPTPLGSDEVHTGWRGQSSVWGGGCTSGTTDRSREDKRAWAGPLAVNCVPRASFHSTHSTVQYSGCSGKGSRGPHQRAVPG